MYTCLLPYDDTRHAILRLLLNFGVDMTLVDDFGLSCFKYAGYTNNYEYLETLIKFAVYEKHSYSELKLLNSYKVQIDLFDDFESGLSLDEFIERCSEKNIETYECLIENVISEKVNEFELLKPDNLYRIDYKDHKTTYYFQNRKLIAMSKNFHDGDLEKIRKEYLLYDESSISQDFDSNKNLYKENHPYIPEFYNLGTTVYVFSVQSRRNHEKKDIHCVCIDNQAYLETKSLALIDGFLIEKEKNKNISEMNKIKAFLESEKEIIETLEWIHIISKLLF